MAGGVVILTVHGIGRASRPLDPGEDRTWISVEQFELVLDAVVGRSDVRLTFDDGNASDVEIGLPRLLERGLSAEFFVLAGLLGEPGRLGAADVRELHRAGMRVGSHGWAHRDWRRIDRQPPLQEFRPIPVGSLAELTGVRFPGSLSRSVPTTAMCCVSCVGPASPGLHQRRRSGRPSWLQARTSLALTSVRLGANRPRWPAVPVVAGPASRRAAFKRVRG